MASKSFTMKIDNEYYEKLMSGEKVITANLPRAKAGDVIVFIECNQDATPTGREIKKMITGVMNIAFGRGLAVITLE